MLSDLPSYPLRIRRAGSPEEVRAVPTGGRPPEQWSHFDLKALLTQIAALVNVQFSAAAESVPEGTLLIVTTGQGQAVFGPVKHINAEALKKALADPDLLPDVVRAGQHSLSPGVLTT